MSLSDCGRRLIFFFLSDKGHKTLRNRRRSAAIDFQKPKGLINLKEKILDILKSADGYISGERISETLSISRAAVWKHIKKLKENGYEIESVTNKGYRLVSSPDILTEDGIKSGLKTDFIGHSVYVYDVTDSTNNRAKECSSAPDGSLFIADVQTGGKGRLGRSWASPSGTGIWMSLLLKPRISLADISQITLVAGLAVCRAIGNGAVIKWPNDIVIGTKKVCGILTEMSAEINMVNYVVCGIGINVNTAGFDDELSEKATSLLIETGETLNRAETVSAVLNEFESLYTDFLENGLKNILPEYKSLCVTLNRKVKVTYQGEVFTAKAADIDNTGSLVIERGGEKITVNSGEVSVRGIYGYI